jgi:predicted SAM-dependent methyltransferase
MLPRHILAPLRAEIHLALVRFRSLFAIPVNPNADSRFLVNVGAGPNGLRGWINIDAWWKPGVDLIRDCRRSLPFKNGTVDGIFCEHFLEHIDYFEDVPVFLAECHRQLKMGGVLRIIVPDASKYVRAYATDGWNAMRELSDRNFKTKMELLNDVFRGGGWRHKYAYDYETLDLVMREAGFQIVQQMGFGVSNDPALAVDSPGHAPESLYVEATK